MKRIISLILVFCMIFSSVTIAESLSTEEKRREIVSREGETIVSIVEKFSDMKDHWSTQWVEKLLEKDVISGYPDGTFKPDKAINRAEFTKLLVVALHDDSEVFEGGHWAKNYIEKAIQEGYILEGEFKDVDKNITRAEMARMIARAMEEEPENWKAYKNNIADYTNIKVEYREYVLQVYAAGIVKGLPNGRFAPEKTASRAEASTMLVKLIEPDERDIPEIMEEPVSEEDFIEPQLELKNNDILENYIIHSIVVKNHEDYIGVEEDYQFKIENITYPKLNQRQFPNKEIKDRRFWRSGKGLNHPTVIPKGSIYDLPAFFYTTVEHEKNFHLKEGMKMKYKVTVKKGDIEKEYFVEGKLKFIMDYYKDYPQYKE
ncbi:S-layer homology domain-containing protein [Clostridiisalibacter paucivorans]|uniref:S-layer homology domain-containing protein n=1 Tax=Clostridiisalibacter paucivorans TaxID=408753 RepID=UPI00146FAE28|nr:S-layer homology domain-containing protein [Clostridiisalibacter paucivorans]